MLFWSSIEPRVIDKAIRRELRESMGCIGRTSFRAGRRLSPGLVTSPPFEYYAHPFLWKPSDPWKTAVKYNTLSLMFFDAEVQALLDVRAGTADVVEATQKRKGQGRRSRLDYT